MIAEHQAVLGLVVLGAMFVAFARERYPVAVVSVLGVCAFLVLGLLDAPELFSVFSNPAPITIAAMFILSGALVRTGVIDLLGNTIVTRAAKRPRLAVAQVMLAVLVASAFVNNTPVVVVLVPIMYRLAAATGFPVKKLMMPLSIVAVLGGSLTLIGTSTNLIVDGIAREQGLAGFGIFEITPYGAATAAAGLLGLLLLSKFLPSDPPSNQPGGEDANVHDYLSELIVRGKDGEVIGKPVAALGLRRRGLELLAVKRSGDFLRRELDDLIVKAGDRFLVRASSVALLTLRESERFEIGLSGGLTMPPGEGEVVEGMIAPSHPSIGQTLADLPSLQRLRVRILGISRERHLPGPDLAKARVRAADRLLIAGDEAALRALRDNHNWIGVNTSRVRPFRRDKGPIAVAALAGVVVLSALDIMPIAVAAVLAIGLILLTRCIDGQEAWSAIDGNVLVLIFAMLAVGVALEDAGSVQLMVSWIGPILREAPAWALVFLVYFFAVLLSELLSNNAVAAILTPIVIALAQQMGTDPRPLVIALMIGASVCFATPIGYQTNMMVYAAGDYRFMDFVKIGTPLNILCGAAACLAIVLLY